MRGLRFSGGWQMNKLLRLLIIAGLAACAIVLVALGFVRHDVDLLAPVNLVLFVLGVLVYLLPTGLAMYRDCKSTAWIAVVNVLLGWAASGRIREPGHPIGTPPTRPVPGR